MNTVAPTPAMLMLNIKVAGLQARLAEKRIDAATFKRMSEAAKDTAQLAKELSAANEEQATLALAETQAEKAAVYARFREMTVTVRTPEGETPSAIGSRYNITYEQLAYDIHTRRSDFAQRTVNGFAALGDEAYDYLIECKPEAIPLAIIDLAPGDPREAFGRYFIAMRRGYLSSPAIAQ
jgi:hypothetical protein